MTNGLTLVASILLMLYYVLTYLLRINCPALAAMGLMLLTFGMWIDNLHPIYTITTGIAAFAAFYGALREPP